MKKVIIFPVVVLMSLVIGCQQDMSLKVPEQAKSMLVSPFQSKTVSDVVFNFVTDPPRFPGGDQELSKFLSRHIRYPKEAQKNNIAGTVFVQFVVTSDGAITDVKTVGKVLGGGLEEESIRVVEAMPNWIPGKEDGKDVNVQFNLPIRYELQK